MIKKRGSGTTIRPDQTTSDMKSLELKSNTELLKAIDGMMALPAEEIDMDFVDECLDILQKRAPVMEDYDPMKTLDKLQEEHPALFEIEENPPVEVVPKAAVPKPKHGKGTALFRYTGAFVAAVLCFVVTAGAFGYKPVRALFKWANDTVEQYRNPSGLMELSPDDPSEYRSLDDALETNGLDSADRLNWIPKDYSFSYVRVDRFSNVIQISAIYESERGELVVQILTSDGLEWKTRTESDVKGTKYEQNNTVYFISTNVDLTIAGWDDEKYSYEISGQISEKEIKKMIDSIT